MTHQSSSSRVGTNLPKPRVASRASRSRLGSRASNSHAGSRRSSQSNKPPANDSESSGPESSSSSERSSASQESSDCETNSNMGDPSDYRLVYSARSDGVLHVAKGSKKEENAPTDAQLDTKPDARGVVDYYKMLEPGDAKHIDWKRKLGGMLMREIGDEEHRAQNFILAALPENYRLYEHVRFTKDESEKTGELTKSSKNHAGGSNDRQDAYLYGHPEGRKKRYRSPADYFPHLLWLSMDEVGDPDNCSCKMCAPEDIQGNELWGKPGDDESEIFMKDYARAKKGPIVTKENSSAEAANTSTNPMVVIPQRKMSQEKLPKSVPKPMPSPALSSTSRTSTNNSIALAPTPLALSQCFEQDLDSHPGKYLFRLGELVWVQKGTTAWSLAIIIMRDLFKDQRHQDRPKYLVQPLSHPFSHPGIKIISQENLLRPWLAWSPPAPTHTALAAPGLSYDMIDWSAVIRGRYGDGDAEVDGSIFAAQATDQTFTPIQPLSLYNNTQPNERSYCGLYFGGEKLWVGEAIRLRVGTGQDIMVLHRIVEKLKPLPTPTDAHPPTITLIGDIYTFTTTPHIKGREPPQNFYLPKRLHEDLAYRNRATISKKGTIAHWALLQSQARLGLADVKGRWYESSVLLPILRGATDFTRDLERGEIPDGGHWMNGRGDHSSLAGRQGTRFGDRIDVFGRAVPTGTLISRGMDGPEDERVFPVGEPNPAGVPVGGGGGSLSGLGGGLDDGQRGGGGGGGLGLHGGVSDGAIAEFMDLERMEEGGYLGGFVGDDGGGGGGAF